MGPPTERPVVRDRADRPATVQRVDARTDSKVGSLVRGSLSVDQDISSAELDAMVFQQQPFTGPAARLQKH